MLKNEIQCHLKEGEESITLYEISRSLKLNLNYNAMTQVSQAHVELNHHSNNDSNGESV